MDPTILLLAQPSATQLFERQAKSLIEASEANIARIESQIKDLVRLRDRERGIITRLRMAIAPIHKLPAELLVAVFRLVCNDFKLSQKREIIKVHALSQVCTYWRQLAHTTPQLWTLDPSKRLSATPTHSYIAGVKRWLERSTPLPVPVSLRVTGNGMQADTGALMDVLVTAAHRWKEASFILNSLSLLSRVPPNALQTLEDLRLYIQGEPNDARIETFLTASLLRRLHLTTRQTILPPMPWSQLTNLTVNSPSLQACLDALLQCKNIVSATFSTELWAAPPDLSAEGITTLTKLETLRLIVSNPSYSETHMMPFFVSLALPALKDLSLSLAFDVNWASPEFTQFQTRSPNIERLSFDGIDSNLLPGDLLTILRHAPSLIELNVAHCEYSFDDSLVASLRYSDANNHHLAPRLNSLSLSYYRLDTDFRETALGAMIQSRWWTDDQLLALPAPPRVARWSKISISVDEEDEPSPEFKARLDEYRAQGLDVYVGCS